MARFIEPQNLLVAGLLVLASTAQAQTSPDSLPPSPDLVPYQWFASTDARHKNVDFLLLKPGETQRIPLAAGALERLWSTALAPDKLELTLEAGPRRSQLLLADGKASRGLFENKTFTFFPGLKNDSLAQLDKGAILIATNKSKLLNKWFYQVTVRPTTSPQGATKPSEVSRRLFKISLAAGEEKQVESWDKPGQIYEFSVASAGANAETYSKLRLKASFDGQNAIDAPLLSLAGQVAGDGMLQNAVGDFDGSRLILRWPMPFASAKISLVNESDKPLNLDIGARVSEFATAPSPYRFCAIQRSAKTVKDKPVDILDVTGKGAFVGLALSISPQPDSPRRTFAYLEGNESIIADGKTFEGTGTEDYFSSAWYFPDKPFSHPFEGLTLKSAAPPAVSAYRLMLPDAVPFEKSLKFNFEQGNNNNTSDMQWTWTAFWYQKTPVTLPQDASASTSTVASTPEDKAPVAPGDRWKIGVAVAIGVVLGIVSAMSRRKRRV